MSTATIPWAREKGFAFIEKIVLPGRVVDEGELAKVVSFVQSGDDPFAVNHDVDGSFEDDVPGNAFVSLVKHFGNKEREREK